MGFHIRELTSGADAIDVMQIRNANRHFMTHDARMISSFGQLQWFKTVYKVANEHGGMFGFIGNVNEHPMAYGMVSKRGDDYWVTGIVDERFQGLGYGEQLFRHLGDFTLELDDHVMLDVLESNDRAVKLYEKLGYHALTEEAGIITMRLDHE